MNDGHKSVKNLKLKLVLVLTQLIFINISNQLQLVFFYTYLIDKYNTINIKDVVTFYIIKENFIRFTTC